MLDVCRTLHASLSLFFYYYFPVCSYLLSYDEIKKMYIFKHILGYNSNYINIQ